MNTLSTKDRRGGLYWKQEKPYISVTTALKVLDKPALQYWFGKMVYLAMVANPAMGEQEALAAPYKVSDKAKARGTTVHSIVEVFKTTGRVVDVVPEYQGYAQAFANWIKDFSVEIIEQEKTATSDAHGIAGTVDIIARINDSTWVIDVKTGKALYPEVQLQTSAYKAILNENGDEITRIGGLLLKENGTYTFEEGTDCFDVFLHILAIYKWQKSEDLEKVGYDFSDK